MLRASSPPQGAITMTKILFASLLVAVAVALVPAAGLADAGSAVQADLTQLSTDLQTLHDTLVPDLQAVTAAAQSGDRAATKAAVVKARTDGKALRPALAADRKQLVVDLEAAKAAGLTGLRQQVKEA